MKILIAEDELISRRLLQQALNNWNYEVIVACNGTEAWEILQHSDTPKLVILDWIMPGLDGIELIQKVRAAPHGKRVYIILLTARDNKADIVTGLQAGADDYVTKPFNNQELCARVRVGERVLNLQRELAARVAKLEDLLSQVKQLQGMLPICSYCKKIRDDQNYWHQIEEYISNFSEADFSHSICPECYEKIVKPQLAAFRKRRQQDS